MDLERLINSDIANRRKKKARERDLREYYKNPNYCIYCNNMIIVGKNESVSDTKKKKFCNKQCLSDYYEKNIKPEYRRTCVNCGNKISFNNKSELCASCLKKEKEKEKVKIWKETGDTGCGISSTLRNCIRNYIFEKQDKKCAICKIDANWNGKELHFILDHINGDASNNFEYNLRLLCPNCDSQLDTYKSRNKNSARSHRKNK